MDQTDTRLTCIQDVPSLRSGPDRHQTYLYPRSSSVAVRTRQAPDLLVSKKFQRCGQDQTGTRLTCIQEVPALRSGPDGHQTYLHQRRSSVAVRTRQAPDLLVYKKFQRCGQAQTGTRLTCIQDVPALRSGPDGHQTYLHQRRSSVAVRTRRAQDLLVSKTFQRCSPDQTGIRLTCIQEIPELRSGPDGHQTYLHPGRSNVAVRTRRAPDLLASKKFQRCGQDQTGTRLTCIQEVPALRSGPDRHQTYLRTRRSSIAVWTRWAPDLLPSWTVYRCSPDHTDTRPTCIQDVPALRSGPDGHQTYLHPRRSSVAVQIRRAPGANVAWGVFPVKTRAAWHVLLVITRGRCKLRVRKRVWPIYEIAFLDTTRIWKF